MNGGEGVRLAKVVVGGLVRSEEQSLFGIVTAFHRATRSIYVRTGRLWSCSQAHG